MCLVVIACLLYMELSGQNQSFDQKSPLIVFLMFVAPFIIWFLGLRSYKKLLGGKMTWKQGIIEGFKISLVFGIVSPVIFLFYYLVINPEIVEWVRMTYQMQGYSNAVVIGSDLLGQFLSAVIFGTIYATIISFFLKSKS